MGNNKISIEKENSSKTGVSYRLTLLANNSYLSFQKIEIDKDNKIIKIWKNKYYGFMNFEGKIIIEPKYTNIEYRNIFSKLIFRINDNNNTSFIDSSGNIIENIFYDEAIYRESNAFITRLNDKYGFINVKENIVVKPIYDEFDVSFYILEKTNVMKLNNKYGIIDNDGIIITPMIYDEFIFDENDDFIICRIGDKYGLLDLKGNTILKPISYKIEDYDSNNNLITIQRNNKYGFLDTSGNILLEPVYDKILKNGKLLKEVELNNNTGFTDNKGKILCLIW